MELVKVLTARQMKEVDALTIGEGLSSEVLMGFAGKAVYEKISARYDNSNKIDIICGHGNNGGDGFIAAYFFYINNYDVRIFFCGKESNLSKESLTYYNLCQSNNITIKSHEDLINDDFGNTAIILDALIGVGFKSALKDESRKIIEKLNSIKSVKISIDIPSGLPADGYVFDDHFAFEADWTLTIGFPKLNSVTYPGKNFCGNIDILDIGFSNRYVKKESAKLISPAYIKEILDINKNNDTYKNCEGHLLLVGGFEGMEGAVIMAARAALETGIGLVTIATSESSRNIIAGKIPEAMTVTIDPSNSIEGLKTQFDNLVTEKKITAVCVGCGLGRYTLSSKVFEALIDIVRFKGISIVIDGDGLFYYKKYKDSHKGEFLNNIHSLLYLTPHLGEASIILDEKIETIKADRVKSAINLSRSCNAVVILKGPSSVICQNDNIFINTTGNAAMACGGSGDVLAGLLSALLSKNSGYNAAVSAAFIHGAAGDLAVKKKNLEILKTTDIINEIRNSIVSIFY